MFLNSNGTVKAEQKISDTAGGFSGTLTGSDEFGDALEALGDLDGDGVVDIAVGAPFDDDGGTDRGAVWILFLNADGTVKAEQKISDTTGGYGGALDDFDSFGRAVAGVGDLDGDGVSDIAVGAPLDDDGGTNRGAVWILFLNADGSVKADQKISDTVGGIAGVLDNGDIFGWAVAGVGDLDGDGVSDIAVGAPGDDDGFAGAAWILFLNPDGTVKAKQKISATAGGLVGPMFAGDAFGVSLAALGDLNGDGSPELAVGAYADSEGGTKGADWILTLDGNAAICGDGVITPVDESCDDGGTLSGDGCSDTCQVEHQIHVYGTAIGGVAEIVVAGQTIAVTTSASDTADDVAAALAAAINAHPILTSLGITATAIGEGVYTNGPILNPSTTDLGLLLHFAPFPTGTLAAWYDFEGDTTDQVCGRDADLVVGTTLTTGYEGQAVAFDGVDDRITLPVYVGPSERPELTMGAWVNPDVVDASRRVILSQSNGGFDRSLRIDDRNAVSSTVGWAAFTGFVANSDVLPTVGQWTFVTTVYDQTSNTARLHVGDQHFNIPDTSVGEGTARLWLGASPSLTHYFDGAIDNVFLFEKALSVEQVNDLRRLGTPGLNAIVDSVGPGEPYCREKVSETEGGFGGTLTDSDEFGRALEALGDLDGDDVPDTVVGSPVADGGGAVWVALLNNDGTVKSEQKIGAGVGGFSGPVEALDLFGQSIGVFPDLDGDAVQDLAVGAMWDDDAAPNAGAVYLLFLNSPDGTVKSEVKLTNTISGLDADDWFGYAVEVIGDLDGDGIPELAASAVNDDDGGSNRGAVYILFLDATGSVVAEQKISDLAGGFTGTLADDDLFGSDLASLGDLDGDDIADLAVGAFKDDTGGSARGAVWILLLNSDGSVKGQQKIAHGSGGFTGALDDGDQFGLAIARLGDLDGDGVVDIGVGARNDDDAGNNRGAGWVLFLNANGTVKSHTKISDSSGGFGGRINDGDWLGQGLTSPGDLDGDGIDDLLIGASRDDDGGTGASAERGAFWALQLAGTAATCGDGVQSALEECDDGDLDNNDGCDTTCEIIPVPEPGQLSMLIAGVGLLRLLNRRRAAVDSSWRTAGRDSK